MNRRAPLKLLTASLALGFGLTGAALAQSGGTIKVGILHSLSGTMAISETVLKDTVLMAIDAINAKGGVMGKILEPVVVDPASNRPLFAEKTKQLPGQDKAAVILGCWTWASRKSVLPVVEEMNGLLFYPVQYEGEELSKNVFYTGAAPKQQPIPAVDYLMGKDGGGKTAVVSTINGDSNVPFYKELGNAGLKAKDVPVVAFSVGEEALRGVDTKPLVGHLAAWNYFMSIKNPANDEFIKKWSAYAKAKNLPGADKPLTNDPMEATYIGINMWKQAVEKAKMELAKK